ncbi:hypothetical protein NLI96_g6310 [Meripilus lineatus]|uniref:Aminoglycoside phosphotransferase domain-containing protein n=1 Tax=Meripilus lineatus TaxID=2056292 RepID=A0AAD5V3L6_9APHY|nr:hypothetical protein NLI96_g6310 [Physisporinus lineatus]
MHTPIMSGTSCATNTIRPRFPQDLHRDYPLPCPPVQKRSSWLSKTFWYYVHELILLPFSRYYRRLTGIRSPSNCIHPLPFGLALKRHGEITEEEVLNMNLANAMGIPAPRAFTFGFVGGSGRCLPSIVMTMIPGVTFGSLEEGKVDIAVFQDDLAKILARMRSFANPWGDAVCGVDGGPIMGPLIPKSPLFPPSPNEAGFQQNMRDIASCAVLDNEDEKLKSWVGFVEDFFSLPPHAIVFTHGDLIQHNIMVDPESGHITGIIDWESAAWLPDYWEFSINGIRRKSRWDRLMNEQLSKGVYEKEVKGHCYLFNLTSQYMF